MTEKIPVGGRPDCTSLCHLKAHYFLGGKLALTDRSLGGWMRSNVFGVIILIILISVVGCGPEWHGSRSFPSPDGQYVVVVTVELQGANDPEPWWQHVSIFRAGDEKRPQTGNLFVYSSTDAPTIMWTGPRDLRIDMRNIGHSVTGPIHSSVSDEVSITATLHRPQINER
jgi:hypothetical protein